MKIWITGYRVLGFSIVGSTLILTALGFLVSPDGSGREHNSVGSLCSAVALGIAGISTILYAVCSSVAVTTARGIVTVRRGLVEWTSCRGYSWEHFHGSWMSSDYISLIVDDHPGRRRERISEVTTSPFGRSNVHGLVNLLESKGIRLDSGM